MRYFSPRFRRVRLFAGSVLALLVLAILLWQIPPFVRFVDGVRGGLLDLGTGIASSLEHFFYPKGELITENAHLTSEVQALAVDTAAEKELQEKFDALSALSGYATKSHAQITPAAVIGRSGEVTGETILIDRGEADGVKLGDPVVVGDGLYLGRIVQVHALTSVARLLTDTESKVSVEVQNKDQTIGIADGQGGLLLSLSFIPQATEINVNDVIVTSGLDPQVPSGLVIGTVSSVQMDEHDPFQSALVEPLADTQHLTMVGVIHQTSS